MKEWSDKNVLLHNFRNLLIFRKNQRKVLQGKYGFNAQS